MAILFLSSGFYRVPRAPVAPAAPAGTRLVVAVAPDFLPVGQSLLS
jgi:hypothetical protein